MSKTCTNIQKSLEWCEGTPSPAGIRRRLYYLSDSKIVTRPAYKRDELGRATDATLEGSFVLAADAKWLAIDILPDKSQLVSESQGEYPNITQLNKLTAVHPGTGPEATALSSYVNNTSCTYLVPDMLGRYRVVGAGNDKYITKSTVAQDLGQGATGNASTTLNVEATDEMPAPFYVGTIVTEDGEIDCSGEADPAPKA